MRYKLFGLCIILSTLSFAQEAKHYAFTHFSTSNGLASNIVRGALQDENGFMWFNTINGVQRYDGNKFITFRSNPSDPSTIPLDDIYGMIEDGSNNLWFYNFQYVGIFDKNKFVFNEVPVYGNTTKDPYKITFIGKDANGTAVIYVQFKGIFRYDKKQNLFVPLNLFRLPPEWIPTFIQMSDDNSKMILGCYPGLVIYDFKTGHISCRGHNEDKPMELNYLENEKYFFSLMGKIDNQFWYATWPPDSGRPFVKSMNLQTGGQQQFVLSEEFPQIGYYEVAGMLKQRNGRCWMYGKSFILEYTGKEQHPFQIIPNEFKDEQSIKFDHALYMYEDNQNNVWVCTDNGLFLFSPDAQSFFSYNLSRPGIQTTTESPAQTLLDSKDGTVYIGGWGTGLYCYDRNFKPLPLPAALQKYSAPYSIWDIKQMSDGLIWFGFQGGTILVYDPVKKTAVYIDDTIFHHKTIRQVTEDQRGNIWIGTHSGQLVEWNRTASGNDVRKGYTTIKKIDSSFINKVLLDNGGYVWAASEGRGLFKYNSVSGKLEDHITAECPVNHRLWNNTVQDVYQYNDSMLLIACGTLDILNLRTNEITHITTQDGLPSNTVCSIAKDAAGTLWLGMTHGLCRLNLDKKIFFVYDRRDGIAYDNFNPAAVAEMKDKRLVYPTDHNFVVFDPSIVPKAPKPPKTHITDFKLAGESLNTDSVTGMKEIRLSYGKTSLTIEFSALNFTRQSKLHYHYKLDGLDKDWNESNSVNQAIYNFLEPGDYTFHVKAVNSNGDEGSETLLHIVVIPPFYATWWFLGLIILFAVGILYWIDRERVKRLAALQKMRTQIAGDLHEEINSTLNNINLLSEMAKIKADRDVERSKEYIEQISDKSKRMMDAMDDMVWSINPANDSMEKTILRMQEFAEATMHEYNADILMKVDEKIKELKLDMKLRHELFLIFKEALQSIAESTPGAQTIINVDTANSKFLLKIRTEQLLQSNGNAHFSGNITEMKKRAATINAELDIQEDKKGTSIVLLIPLY